MHPRKIESIEPAAVAAMMMKSWFNIKCIYMFVSVYVLYYVYDVYGITTSTQLKIGESKTQQAFVCKYDAPT